MNFEVRQKKAMVFFLTRASVDYMHGVFEELMPGDTASCQTESVLDIWSTLSFQIPRQLDLVSSEYLRILLSSRLAARKDLRVDRGRRGAVDAWDETAARDFVNKA